MSTSPVLERRDAVALLGALRSRLPAYVPGWEPPPRGPAEAMLEIYARYLRALADRIDDAPAKNELAFLDLLGITLLPAQAARAAVVFSTIAGLGDGRAPVGTRVAAKTPPTDSPLVFETERAVGLAEARLAEVVTVWPGRDAYADHSVEAIGGRPFTLWEPLQQIRHELYLAHDGHFALTGTAVVELEVELERGGGRPLRIAWQYWDGGAWRDFKRLRNENLAGQSYDGTWGFTRNGTVRLAADCAEAAKTAVGGWSKYWIRGVLDERLPPGPELHVPLVDRIALSTVVERPAQLTGGVCEGGLLPDTAFAGAEQLDFTKLTYPLGRSTGVDTALYIACDEAFSRPGATVTICVDDAKTAEEEADEKLAPYEAAVNAASSELASVSAKIAALIQTLDALVAAELPETFDDLFDDQKIALIRNKTNAALAAIRDGAGPAQWEYIGISIGLNPFSGLPGVGAAIAGVNAAIVIYELALALSNLTANPSAARVAEIGKLKTAIDGVQNHLSIASDMTRSAPDRISAAIRIAGAFPGILVEWWQVAINLSVWQPSTSIVEAELPGQVSHAKQLYEALQDHIEKARKKLVDDVKPKLAALKLQLDEIPPAAIAAAAGVKPPKLNDPKLAWEYWNGRAWVELVAPSANGVKNLMTSGTFTFTVGDDWLPSMHNSVAARWLRARVHAGSYARVRVVSWKDTVTKELRYMAFIEARPPALDALRIGYRWESEPSGPERCLTLNDFQWADRTQEAAWRGDAFAPYEPTQDATPALYLGFDGALPSDLLGILLDVEEVAGEEDGPPLDWQYWDGAGWRQLTVEDETAHLALPGIAYVLWPGVPASPSATVTAADGREVRLADERDAARFAAGQLLHLRSGDDGELLTVEAVDRAVVTTAAPLMQAYTSGTVAAAGLPRFGMPRAWLRARLRDDGEPRRVCMRGVHPNAVWAAQVETVENELLGSGDGTPRQTLFFTRTPVLHGQEIEVRELEGRRAHVELPLLVETLAPLGIREGDLTVDRDARTGEARAVWVPWQERPNLFFSGAGDRHYTVERTRGRLQFGDGQRGRIPPAGNDNVRARRYRAGGGARGNVAAGALLQVVSGLVVAGVTNPRAAEGGAEGAPIVQAIERGPLTVRSRRQAISLADYEALAREASPAVAVARAQPGPIAGAVTVTVVPGSEDAQPQPTFGLRRGVREFLVQRTPAALAHPPYVVGPEYEPIGVRATIAPLDPSAGGAVATDARRALARFLHPLTGGPDGAGWPFGRDIYLSDVAALLERLDGVDYVETLQLLVGGSPQAERAPVPEQRLVAAGPIRVTLVGAER